MNEFIKMLQVDTWLQQQQQQEQKHAQALVYKLQITVVLCKPIW